MIPYRASILVLICLLACGDGGDNAKSNPINSVKSQNPPSSAPLDNSALADSYISPSGRFRIHYEVTGDNAITEFDENHNGVPDDAEVVAVIADSVLALVVDEMGYQLPPGDGDLGGGDEYDVYIVDLSEQNVYGFTYPVQEGKTTHSYIEIDNNYSDFVYIRNNPEYRTEAIRALRVTLAHLIYKAVGWGYYKDPDSIWWEAATATWMEEVAYPEVDDYLQYLSAFMEQPGESLDSGNYSNIYVWGRCLFVHFLDQRFGRGLIRSVWEEIGRQGNARLEHFDRVIRQETTSDLTTVVSEFALWNYFTGSRHRPGYYAEGDLYPEVATRQMLADSLTSEQLVGSVNYLGSVYIELLPQDRTGEVTLETALAGGRWNRQLLLVGPEGVRVEKVDGDTTRISAWESYEEIVLVLTAAEWEEGSYQYRVAAELK